MLASANLHPPALYRRPEPAVPDAPLATRRCFADAQEQASELQGWNQDYLQLSAGAFHGEICQVHGTGIRLFIEQIGQSMLQTGVLENDVLAVGIPLHASGASFFCGTPCTTDTLHVFSGSSGFEFRPSRQHTMLGIELRLGSAALAEVDGVGVQGRDPALPRRPGALKLAPDALAQLQAHLLELLLSAQVRPDLLSRPAVVSSVADFLLDHMARHIRSAAPAGSRADHWSLVRRAIAIVHDRPESPLTVAQLCLALGVSRRTLQSAFHLLLETSPLAYLKSVRLHQARQALKRAASVTEAATSCGFWHFGHFSQDYQNLFGEKPSETLRHHSGR